MKNKEEIKKQGEELAFQFGYNSNLSNLHFINVADAFCIGYTMGAKEVSIGFAKWLDNRRLEKAIERQKRKMELGRKLNWEAELPNEELYELYLKTQK